MNSIKSVELNGRNVCGHIYSERLRLLTLEKIDDAQNDSISEFLFHLVQTISSKSLQVLKKHIIRIQIGRMESQFGDKVAFIAQLALPKNKTFSKILSNYDQLTSVDGEQVVIEFCQSFVPCCSTPFSSFNSKCKFKTLEYRWQSEEGDQTGEWIKSESESNWFKRAVEIKDKKIQIDFVLDHVKPDDAAKYLAKFKESLEFMEVKPEEEEAEIPPIPWWTLERIEQLQREHGARPKWFCKGDQRLCTPCFEYNFLKILEWWMREVFIKSRTTDLGVQCILRNKKDAPPIQKKKRSKALVIKGPRECGKTLWFLGAVDHKLNRVVHIKNRVEKSQVINANSAWLILLDDYDMQPQDRQMIKSVFVGDATTWIGKWVSERYAGGLPCVVLLNDDETFWKLFHDEAFKSQAVFLDMGKVR